MGLIVQTDKIDTKTGEIVESSHKRGFDLYTEEGYLFINKQCTHLMGKKQPNLSLGLDVYATFYCLINNLMGFDNVLIAKDGRKLRYADIDDFVSLMGCSKRQMYRRIKPLLDENILCKLRDATGEEYYVVNPVYALFGHRLSFRLYMDFRDSMRDYLKNTVSNSMEALISQDAETRKRLLES